MQGQVDRADRTPRIATKGSLSEAGELVRRVRELRGELERVRQQVGWLQEALFAPEPAVADHDGPVSDPSPDRAFFPLVESEVQGCEVSVKEVGESLNAMLERVAMTDPSVTGIVDGMDGSGNSFSAGLGSP